MRQLHADAALKRDEKVLSQAHDEQPGEHGGKYGSAERKKDKSDSLQYHCEGRKPPARQEAEQCRYEYYGKSWQFTRKFKHASLQPADLICLTEEIIESGFDYLPCEPDYRNCNYEQPYVPVDIGEPT
jgi:hypothetical protein